MQEVDTKRLFELSNNMANFIVKSPEALSRYLITAANCRHYTVSNQLLILSGMNSIAGNKSNPTLVLTEEAWIQYGINVLPGAKPIWIMEYAPNSKYEYIPRPVFDLSQTSGSYQKPVYEIGSLCEKMYMIKPCKVEFNDELRVPGTKCYYRSGEECIQVRSGFKTMEELFCNLSTEYAHYFFHKETNNKDGKNTAYNRAVNKSQADMTGMINALYFGVIKNIDIKEVPEFLSSNNNSSKIKEKLNDILKPAYYMMDNIDKLIVKENQRMGAGYAR